MDLKIKDEQLVQLQALVNQVSHTQMELGQVESRKFDLIAAIPVFRKDLENFQKQLEDEYGKENIKQARKGRVNGGTWVHPLLAIDIALALSPKLKIEVYKWIHDELLKNRNNSGDSYNMMVGALFAKCTNYTEFKNFITKVATIIRKECGVAKSSDWESASADQLEHRDELHSTITTLANVLSSSKAHRIAVVEGVKEVRRKRESRAKLTLVT